MKKIIKFITFIFIIIALTTVYARYVGTYGFITKEYAVTDEYLPSGFDGLKIVHLSDIHYNRAITISKIKDIVKEINLIRPDIVVFTGDLVDKDVSLSDKDFNDLTNALLKIDAKYGKYAILGNHDVEYNSEKVIDVFNGSNFKYLD
ncbi:MAG: metallophosphoesterase, partial [Bacilli bacterium]|nr:metallophosphoesterase [Bacilli bacterium]